MSSLTGQEIGGYQIGPLLGSGGMGEVYQAYEIALDRQVAIKFLRADYTTRTEVQQRFIREIRILEALDHENIIPIYRYGLIEGKLLFFTMKLMQGVSLALAFKKQAFSPIMYWQVLQQVAAGLEYGHQQNVVHRDVKPDNIFVERLTAGTPHVYLVDFGLGKRYGQDMNLTEAEAVIGTPQYMPPEGILGEGHGIGSDIYSLAVVSYEALVGRVPFNESHAHKTAIAHVTQPPPAPSSLNPDFPPSLERVLLRGLEKRAEDRYASIQAFAQAYYDALRGLSAEQQNSSYRATR